MKRKISAILIAVLIIIAIPSCDKKVPSPKSEGVNFTTDSVYENFGNDIYTASDPLTAIPNTLEAWIRVPSEETANGVIFGNFDNHTNYSLNFAINNGSPRVYWADLLETTYDITFESVDVRGDTPVHVAFVNDTEKSLMHCYINGELMQSVSAPEFDISVILPSFAVGGNNRALNASYFRGTLYSVAAFSDIRTSKQIRSDMNQIVPEDESLLAYYELSPVADGQKIPDLSKNGIDLTYSNMWLTNAQADELRNKDFERAFCIAAVPDTQYMAKINPDKLPVLYDWITANEDIDYVVGLGDITDQSTQAEWEIAKSAISKMNGKVEYSLIRGNHDEKSMPLFDKYFANDDEYTRQFEQNGGFYKEGSVENTYRTIKLANADFLLLNLDYYPDEGIVEWAKGVVDAHPSHKVIISTHAYLYADKTMTGESKILYDQLVDKCKNVELVLCGHISDNQILHSSRKTSCGNTVDELLIDAQDYDRTRGGLGMVALLYFNEDGTKFETEYYSTVLDRYYLSENFRTVDLTATAKDGGAQGLYLKNVIPQGSGSKDDPYLISEAGNLKWLAASITDTSDKGSFDGVYFKQTNDIDLGGRTIYSIGSRYYSSDTDMRAFGGYYDGNGFPVKNGIVRNPEFDTAGFNKEYGYGLFGVLYGGTVKNLTLDNMTVVTSGVGGALVGKTAGKSFDISQSDFNIIENCTVKANCKTVCYFPNTMQMPQNIELDSSDCAGITGGIVGMARSATVKGCVCEQTLNTNVTFFITGGIAGSAGYNTVISDCTFTGKINEGSDETLTDKTVALESPTDITVDVGDNNIGTLTLENNK